MASPLPGAAAPNPRSNPRRVITEMDDVVQQELRCISSMARMAEAALQVNPRDVALMEAALQMIHWRAIEAANTVGLIAEADGLNAPKSAR